jgi:signal peptidase II
VKRRDWLLVLISLLATWGIDRVTKNWAETIHGVNFHGPLGFVLYHNRGAMLGLFSNLPAVLRVVSLSTGGAFLLFSFMIIQYILPIKSLPLRTGLSILLGGILGNVTDRIMYGFVIDFILVGSPEASSPAFNMADALQWVGYAIIVWSLIREGEILWPEGNNRNLRWVNLKFQLRYCLTLMGVGFGLSVIAGVYSYTFLRVTILDLVGNNPKILAQYLTPFVFTFLIIAAGFGIILFITGRIISQRIAGPVYAFEKFMDDLLQGKARPLRLRTGDEFKHLEELAVRISTELLKRQNLASANEQALANAISDQLQKIPSITPENPDENSTPVAPLPRKIPSSGS